MGNKLPSDYAIGRQSGWEGVKRFIYASGSVYGVKTEDKVTEELTLEPLSEYNKTKMVSERVLKSYSGQMKVQIVRPATGLWASPRMRLMNGEHVDYASFDWDDKSFWWHTSEAKHSHR